MWNIDWLQGLTNKIGGGGGLKSYTNFHNVWGSLLNAIGGENFEKMRFDPN